MSDHVSVDAMKRHSKISDQSFSIWDYVRQLPFYDYLAQIPPIYLVLGLFVSISSALIKVYGVDWIISVVLIWLPLEYTLTVLSMDEDGDRFAQVLIYWIAFSTWHLISEHALDMVATFFFPSIYPIFKIFFSVWLFHPKTLGALWVYKKVSKPLLVQHTQRIEQVVSVANDKTNANLQYAFDQIPGMILRESVIYIYFCKIDLLTNVNSWFKLLKRTKTI
jgi:receptor expression-enhancing protein 5/6